jgi:hypothetical protein
MKFRLMRARAFVNEMSLRERLLLFLAVVALLGAVVDYYFITPLIKLQAQQARELNRRSAEMESQKYRMDTEMMGRRKVRMAELDAEIGALQGRIDAVDREIAALGSAGADLAAQRSALTRALKGTERVTLLRVSSGDAVPPGAPQAAGSLEFALAGSYFDLAAYLADLERALPQARWSALRFSAETTPPQVSVRIVAARGTP